KQFGKTFPEPKSRFLGPGAKIMALNDPKKKMSKSIPQSCLYLFDEPEVIRKKIMSAVTDTGKVVRYDPKKKPGISNLLVIYSLFSQKPIKEIEKKFKGSGYAKFKKSLADLVVKNLEPLQKKRKELLKREVYVKEILERGRKKAQAIAQSTIKEVKRKMGLE
ncbi:MAG TPA: tryptophan--tRNA ligase, partial [Candidatus Parcubacteria bacterium]|nr:tryptophan--tRNA ligase [Candidatus Parcubacteria bacterium]